MFLLKVGYWNITHDIIILKFPYLTLYLKEMPFNTFANRANPALTRTVWSGSTHVTYGNMMYLILHLWTWQVVSLFNVPTWKFICIIIHSGWSLAWIFMKEKSIFKDTNFVIYGIISEFTDKVQFHYLTKLKGPQVGNYLYTTQFLLLR